MAPENKSYRYLWYWLLIIPYVFVLWVPFFNHLHPKWAGIPFFYWYQFLWVGIGAILTAIVYKTAP